MDSGISASIQSSNGNGGDDQDLLDSSSSFFNVNPISAPHQHLFPTHQNPTFFDPPKHTLNNLDHDHDLIWSMGLKSPPQNYCSNFGNSSSRTQSQPGPFPGPSQTESHATGTGASLRPDHLSGATKNPKKRVRASNRATTTVLKTDTANFRQMVQEFTGFPTASFPGPPYSRQPDLFSSAVRPGGLLDAPGPTYPIRPFLPLFPSLLNNPTTIDSNIVSTNHDMSGFRRDLQEIHPCANDNLHKL